MIAVDAAPSMVEAARAQLPADVDVRRADLLDLALEEPVDAVLSTATFHWIGDHERLFANLHAALKPGGRLVAQCGGAGNVARDQATPASPPRPSRRTPSTSPTGPATGTSRRPRTPSAACAPPASPTSGAGSRRLDVDPGDRAGYLRAICLGSFLDRLPEELREPFLAAALARLPDPLTIHYVRLNSSRGGRAAGAPVAMTTPAAF